METWFIGPLVGAAFGLAGWLRGREANRRLARIEAILIQRATAPEHLEEALAPSAAHPSRRRPSKPRKTKVMLDLVREVDFHGGAAELAAAIRRLPEREQLAIALRYFEGLTVTEIGSVLGVSAGQVDSLLHRAHRHLRQAVV